MLIKKYSKILLLMLIVTIISFNVACSNSDTSDSESASSDTEESTSSDENTNEDENSEDESSEDENNEDESNADGNSDEKVFTEKELSEYDGKNGNSAYVAINGVVYDVTNSEEWNEGEHKGVTAGKDLTDELGSSPHGDSVLGDLPVVGKLE